MSRIAEYAKAGADSQMSWNLVRGWIGPSESPIVFYIIFDA